MKLIGKRYHWLFALVLLAGCSTTPDPVDTEQEKSAAEQAALDASGQQYDENGNPINRMTSEEGSFGGPGGEGANANGLAGQGQSALAEPAHTIHFGLNSSLVSEEARSILIENARWIKQSGKGEVIIEGHCDERGTREFNLALGQKRADAVKQFLTSQGVDWYRLRTVSFGKEKPVEFGHNERAWSANRRSELRLK